MAFLMLCLLIAAWLGLLVILVACVLVTAMGAELLLNWHTWWYIPVGLFMGIAGLAGAIWIGYYMATGDTHPAIQWPAMTL